MISGLKTDIPGLDEILEKGKAQRALQIEKMLGTKHDPELRPYDIKQDKEFVFYPQEEALRLG